ncbi:MAG: hypothetical protein AAB262_10270, partial [Elusimicrobiota bacterium]
AHAYPQVVADMKGEGTTAEMVVILFAHTGAVSSTLIDEGVMALLDDPSLDSAVTVSCYDRWTPRRAFRESPKGLLTPYAACVPETGPAWFPDWGAIVARPRLLEALTPSSTPLSYLGKNLRPLKQAGGGPVDRQWQVPKMEYWLKKQGVQDNPHPEPIAKLQPAPKKNRRR